ncbi:MAG: septal ring lytic transglycosylase RlpA family protein [Chitinophagaceae bacterium]|nr:septal ring lytic transglycosylase RlpA family protein [Chitinophagaceae bacterium]
MPVQKSLLIILLWVIGASVARAQDTDSLPAKKKFYYGTASYYADKFEGRKTASGEIFSQKKMTAACNVLPLGTWIKVTNLRNGKSVIVKTNDRLHPRMTRIVDLSRSAAQQLGYIRSGLARVKVEVYGKKKPKNT